MSSLEDETIQARKERLARVPRACEACKIRKIRCDRSRPCSNCRTSSITCRSTDVVPANDSRPDRVTQLKQLLERLDERLDERLGRIERQITNQTVTSKHSGHPPISDAVGVETKNCKSSPANVSRPYEGASSFTNLSTEVTEIVQRTTDLEADRDDSTLGAPLKSLETLLRPSNIVSSKEDYQFSRNRAPQPSPAIELFARRAGNLRSSKSERYATGMNGGRARTPIFLNSYAINDPSILESLCQRVYFPTEAISVGHLTAMHGVLYFLLKEYIAFSNPLSREHDLQAHLARCEQNLNAGLEAYEVLAIPSFETILALTMGVIKAQEEAKPLLCLNLISITAGQCHMLGYHRERTYQNDSMGKAQSMRRIFWTLYIFDKNFSLIAGRASCIQDFEIDADYPTLPTDPALRPWDESFLVGIKIARLQGRIYNELYSAAALKSTPTEREQHINDLAAALEQSRTELDNIDSSQVGHPEVFALSRKHWDVMYFSTLTSLLRAPPTPGSGVNMSGQCLRAARMSLESHIRCFSTYQAFGNLEDVDYAHWILHCSSFTPFLVIFLHATSHASWEDVQLLADVVEILRSVRGGSKGSERLYQICGAFAQLAQGLVEARRSSVITDYPQEDSMRPEDQGDRTAMPHLDFLQDYVGGDLTNYLADWEAQDMPAILDSWANGEQSAFSIFHMNMEAEN